MVGKAAVHSDDSDSDARSRSFALKSAKSNNAKFDKFAPNDGSSSDSEEESDDGRNGGNKDGGDDDEDDDDDDEVTTAATSVKKNTKSVFDKTGNDSDDDDDDDDDDDQDNDNDDDEDQYFGFLSGDEQETETNFKTLDNENDVEETARFLAKSITGNTTLGTQKIKKLTPKQLEKEEKKIKRTGVVYMSSLPPYMKPQKIRQIMSRFGEVGRIFLKPEDPKVYKSRIKSGGNKKKKFEEGWVEFTSKSDAKLAASTLNGNILGGKKRSFYHDDVMNVKYLKGFKWFDLTNALNREVEVRESKKQAELSQAHKLNKAYIKNVETSKVINRVTESRKRKAEDNINFDNNDNDSNKKDKVIRRNFKQRNVATNRAGADESIKNKSDTKGLDSVLNKIF